MRIVGALILVLALCSASAQAGINGSIDLFPFGIDPSTGDRTTPDFGSCQATVASLFGGVLYRLSIGVYARLAGATLAGMQTAELYLQGLETDTPGQLPSGWTKNVVIPSPTLDRGQISDPQILTEETLRRWSLTFFVTEPDDPDCQRNPLVLLAIVDLWSISGTNFANNHYVTVVAGTPSSYPWAACSSPILTRCNFPDFTPVCVSGGQLIVNPSGPTCTVAVEQATWSHVKGLYR